MGKTVKPVWERIDPSSLTPNPALSESVPMSEQSSADEWMRGCQCPMSAVTDETCPPLPPTPHSPLRGRQAHRPKPRLSCTLHTMSKYKIQILIRRTHRPKPRLRGTVQHRGTQIYNNIAKGTTDPRVEFILPKSYCKFKHESWSNFIFRIFTQHQLEISTKHQHLH